jgi:hypothetical protein
MSFFDGVTPSTLLAGGSSLHVPAHEKRQRVSWFTSGKQKEAVLRRGKVAMPPRRPATTYNGRSRGNTWGRQNQQNTNRPQTQGQRSFSQYLSKKSIIAKKRSSGPASRLGNEKPTNVRVIHTKRAQRVQEAIVASGGYRSSPLSLFVKLKEKLHSRGVTKDKSVAACVEILEKMAEDKSQAISEMMEEMLPLIANAIYADSVTRSVPFYNLTKQLESENKEMKIREAKFDTKLEMHRKAREELMKQVRSLEIGVDLYQQKLEKEKTANKKAAKINRVQRKKMNHATEQNLSLLGMVTSSESERQDAEKEHRTKIMKLNDDLVASQENCSALSSALRVLQMELEKLKNPKDDQSEISRLSKELQEVKNTLKMQRGQYLQLVDNKASKPRGDDEFYAHLVGSVSPLLPPEHMWTGKVRTRLLSPNELSAFINQAWTEYVDNFGAGLDVWKFDSLPNAGNDEPSADMFNVLDHSNSFSTWLPGHLLRSESEWLHHQLIWGKINLHPKKEKQMLKEVLPQVFISNVKESCIKWQGKSTKFTIFHGILSRSVHEGCYADQLDMVSALRKGLVQLDTENSGILAYSQIDDFLRSFLPRTVEHEFDFIDTYGRSSGFYKSKIAYGNLFEGHDKNGLLRELLSLHVASSMDFKEKLQCTVRSYKGIDNCVDANDIRTAIIEVDPLRPKNSVDNWVGLFLQHSEYATKMRKSSKHRSKRKSVSVEDEMETLKAKAAAFAAARDKYKRVPTDDIVDALNYFFVREFGWWRNEAEK